MKAWHLSKHDTRELYERVYCLENRLAIVENERSELEKTLKNCWDEAVERLLPEVVEKCYVKVYGKEALIRLLDLAEKATNEDTGGEEQ